MVFVVAVVLECDPIPQKPNLKVVTCDVGSARVVIVTNAPNIRKGTRTCVALVGSVLEENGEEITVSKRAVAGVMSEGMICDSVMLGWIGGAKGICVQVPDSFDVGTPAPTSKPRGIGEAPAAAEVEAPAEKALSREEKKAAAAAKKAAIKERLAAKRSAKGEVEASAGAAAAANTDADVEEDASGVVEATQKVAAVDI